MSFWKWIFGKTETTYTQEQIDDLVARIKRFDAGAVDEYLTRHVDKAYTEWLEHHKGTT